MIYADYGFYTDSYLGTAISGEAFPRLALRASQFLDYYTQGRAAKHADMEALKMACCALAEQYQAIDQAEELARKSLTAGAQSAGAELQSESVSSHSRSFRSGGDSAKAAQEAARGARSELAEIARRYLAGTGLLYRGGRCRA